MDDFNGRPVNTEDIQKNDYYRNGNRNVDKEEVVSIGMWLGISIILAIPVLNFIAVIIMAFADVNRNLKNFARAGLILIGLGIFFGITLGGCGMMLYNN